MKVPLGPSLPLVPPLYTSAVYTLPDLDALDAIYNREQPGFIYARDGHPNAAALSAELTGWHKATWGIVTGSGMGAISASVLPFLNSGDRILASNRLYGKTTKLFRELARFGVVTEFVDANDLGAVEIALKSAPLTPNPSPQRGEGSPKLVFIETISNPLCRVVDIPAIARLSHQHGAKLIVDNTFATPVLCRPLELGADMVMESLTKMIGGHSDITLGYLGGTDTALSAPVGGVVSMYGLAANPFDCWLALRSLETMELRTRASTANAVTVAEWLSKQPQVTRVAYPGLANHPDHELARKVLPVGCGHMLAFEITGGRESVNKFMRQAPGIPFAPSLGHTSTTCSHPDTTSHRYETTEEKLKQTITPGLVRLSVGCEEIGKTLAELARGLG